MFEETLKMGISSPQHAGDWMSERLRVLSKSGAQVSRGHETCTYFLCCHATGSDLGMNVCVGWGWGSKPGRFRDGLWKQQVGRHRHALSDVARDKELALVGSYVTHEMGRIMKAFPSWARAEE